MPKPPPESDATMLARLLRESKPIAGEFGPGVDVRDGLSFGRRLSDRENRIIAKHLADKHGTPTNA